MTSTLRTVTGAALFLRRQASRSASFLMRSILSLRDGVPEAEGSKPPGVAVSGAASPPLEAASLSSSLFSLLSLLLSSLLSSL